MFEYQSRLQGTVAPAEPSTGIVLLTGLGVFALLHQLVAAEINPIHYRYFRITASTRP